MAKHIVTVKYSKDPDLQITVSSDSGFLMLKLVQKGEPTIEADLGRGDLLQLLDALNSESKFVWRENC